MAAHLAHRLPWGDLHQFIQLWPLDEHAKRGGFTIKLKQKKTIDHFARCFAAAVSEFRDSDRSTEAERSQFDPRLWPGQREHAIGAWAGFFDSLVGGYILLNILLSDPDKFIPRLFPQGVMTYQFRLMLGSFDGGHPPELAQHFRQAFDGDSLKPLTRDVTQVLRDHAAMLFRCMYSISGTNDFVVPKWISNEIVSVCRLNYIPEGEEAEQ